MMSHAKYQVKLQPVVQEMSYKLTLILVLKQYEVKHFSVINP